MRVCILKPFSTDEGKKTVRHEAGATETVQAATGESWAAKGLAEILPEGKPDAPTPAKTPKPKSASRSKK